MYQKLITKTEEKKWIKLSLENGANTKLVTDPRIIAHFFYPYTGWDWWAIEYYPEEQRFYGLVRGREIEYGHFSIPEFKAAKLPMNLPIERDMYWDDTTTISEIKEKLEQTSNTFQNEMGV